MSKHQGSSGTTPAKQNGLWGIHKMHATRIKSYKGTVIYADVFSGSGMNYVGDQVIDGSPISILRGVTDAIRSFRKEPHQYKAAFIFSDITPDRSTISLPEQVERFQREEGLVVDRDHLIVTNDHGTYVMPIFYAGASAEEMILRISALIESTESRAMLTVDPNGPKDLPIDALESLWRKHQHRLTMNLHVSATHFKRCGKAALATGFDFTGIPKNIMELVKIFTSNPHGWVKRPEEGDKNQWMLLMITRYEPNHGWGNNYLKLSTPEGRALIAEYSLTNKEKKNDGDDCPTPAL